MADKGLLRAMAHCAHKKKLKKEQKQKPENQQLFLDLLKEGHGEICCPQTGQTDKQIKNHNLLERSQEQKILWAIVLDRQS